LRTQHGFVILTHYFADCLAGLHGRHHQLLTCNHAFRCLERALSDARWNKNDAGAIGKVMAVSLYMMIEKPETYWTGGYSQRAATDWRLLKDKAGGGERYRAGNQRAEGQFQFRMGLRNGSGLSHRSFRNQLGFAGSGGGVCGVPGGKGGQGSGGGKGKH